MEKRFVSLWFPYLKTDWFTVRKPVLKDAPFVLASPDHGKMKVVALNKAAEGQDIFAGMSVADARALIPGLVVENDIPGLSGRVLERLARWCIRFTPAVAIDEPGGLILDASGCAHLWNGEPMYLQTISSRIQAQGYHVRLSMAGSIGATWALTRFAKNQTVVATGGEASALHYLPPEALRVDGAICERLHKLGLGSIGDFISIPRKSLQRRFGAVVINRINQALGIESEEPKLIQPLLQFVERLPSMEPIVTAAGIEIALHRLLDKLCGRLKREDKGVRACVFNCFRVDGKLQSIEIATGHAANNPAHLFKLFELRIPTIEPGAGIELFELEAKKVEDASADQQKLWDRATGLDHIGLAELIDRITGKLGKESMRRYLPSPHYWPERSLEPAATLRQTASDTWRIDRPRPLEILPSPERIDVTAPIPDYPPMLFRRKGKLHKIVKADGPERIGQEWWLQQSPHRDYYLVEDENGNRYWIFRAGHYDESNQQWFLHGFFS